MGITSIEIETKSKKFHQNFRTSAKRKIDRQLVENDRLGNEGRQLIGRQF